MVIRHATQAPAMCISVALNIGHAVPGPSSIVSMPAELYLQPHPQLYRQHACRSPGAAELQAQAQLSSAQLSSWQVQLASTQNCGEQQEMRRLQLQIEVHRQGGQGGLD